MITRDQAIAITEEAIGIPLPRLSVQVVDALIAAGAIVIPQRQVDWDYDPDTDTLTSSDHVSLNGRRT